MFYRNASYILYVWKVNQAAFMEFKDAEYLVCSCCFLLDHAVSSTNAHLLLNRNGFVTDAIHRLWLTNREYLYQRINTVDIGNRIIRIEV